jgi:hypothetical protein
MLAELIDEPGSSGRTTATLLASLVARLSIAYTVSGADVIGSLTAGLVALGREAGATATGARLRCALQTNRVSTNGAALWTALRLGDLADRPAAQIVSQLRNDLSLLLADDLEETLELLPIPPEPPNRSQATLNDPDMVDLVLGLWAFGRELVATVEVVATPTLPPRIEIDHDRRDNPERGGALLR